MDNVFWINGMNAPHLAVVLCPLGDDELDGDLREMKRQGVETVVSMLEGDEAVMLGVDRERIVAERAGMQFVSFPIPDTTTPKNVAAFRDFVSGLASRLSAGEKIGVHCRGSIGRATLATACTLMHLGWTADQALTAIKKARGLEVPDTREQLRWIQGYETAQ